MAEEGVIDHQSAKTKAIERLGLPANTAKPDNREIDSALTDYLELFDASGLAERKVRWRQTALEAMMLLEEFYPLLIGPALSGNITRFSAAQILVNTGAETISLLLMEHDIPFDQGERRSRTSTNDYLYLPTFEFVVDDVRIEIICIESGDTMRSLLCPISGKPYERADTNKLKKLLTVNR